MNFVRKWFRIRKSCDNHECECEWEYQLYSPDVSGIEGGFVGGQGVIVENKPSTIVKVEGGEVVVLREGEVRWDRIRCFWMISKLLILLPPATVFKLNNRIKIVQSEKLHSGFSFVLKLFVAFMLFL